MIVLEKNNDLYGRFSAWHPFACAQTYQPKAPLLHMIKIDRQKLKCYGQDGMPSSIYNHEQ